jgi:hypothetical protein
MEMASGDLGMCRAVSLKYTVFAVDAQTATSSPLPVSLAQATLAGTAPEGGGGFKGVMLASTRPLCIGGETFRGLCWPIQKRGAATGGGGHR